MSKDLGTASKGNKAIGKTAALKLGMSEEVYMSLPLGQRSLADVKLALASATPAFNTTTAASQIALHAGTAWRARVDMGKVILKAQAAGITLVQLQTELWNLPADDLRNVRKIVPLGKSKEEPNKNATGLSVLAMSASIFGQDIVSPDGKYVVTMAETEALNLSDEDAVVIARKLRGTKKDKSGNYIPEMSVKTLRGYIDDAAKPGGAHDGGKSRVRKYVESTKTVKESKSKALKLKVETFNAVMKAYKDSGMKDVETYLAHVLLSYDKK